MAHDRYISPFSTRYASDEMQYTFSDDNKFRTWRRLWIALAKAEQKQGLDITDEQIAELEAHKDDINYEEATAREKLVRHDVMSHVYAYGLQCPKAKGIIHLGATSCYVGDNTDVIIMREGLQLVRKKLIGVLANLADFAEQYITVDPTKYDLTEGNDKDFTVTVTGSANNKVSFAEGDKVEFKYWPRIQASNGNSGYTRAFCTWKMVAHVATDGTISFSAT